MKNYLKPDVIISKLYVNETIAAGGLDGWLTLNEMQQSDITISRVDSYASGS